MAHTDEATQIGEVIARIAANYPDCSTADIARVVQTLHAGFDGAKIREFIPLLVEREARDALTHRRTGATPAMASGDSPAEPHHPESGTRTPTATACCRPLVRVK